MEYTAGLPGTTQEDRFKYLAELSPDVIIIMDAVHWRVQYCSRRQVFGFEAAQLSSFEFLEDRIVPEDAELIKAARRRLLKEPQGHYSNVLFRFKNAQGEYEWLQVRETVLSYTPQGRVKELLCFYTIVTDFKKTERALAESEIRFRTIFELAPIGIAIIDKADRFLYANESLCRTLGYTPARLVAMRFADVTHPDDVNKTMQLSGNVRSDDAYNLIEVEKRYLHQSGRIVVGKSIATPFFDENGEPTSMLVLIEDVTQKHQTETALRQSEERFRALIQNSSDVIITFDKDYNRTYVSPSIERMLGYTPQEFIAIKLEDLIAPEDIGAVMRARITSLNQPGVEVYYQARNRRKDGMIGYLEVKMVNLLHDPAVRAVVANMRDVTDRMAAEAALRNSEERFRALIQNSSDIIVTYTKQWFSTYVSPSIETVLGYKAQTAVNLPLADLLHPDDVADVERARIQVLERPGAEVSLQVRLRRQSGSWAFMDLKAFNLLNDPAVQAIVVSLRDLTRAKEVEATLRKSEERFRALIQNSSDVILTLDGGGNRTYVSPSIQTTLGYTPEEYLRLPLEAIVHADDVPLVRETLQFNLRSPGEEQRQIVARYLRKDGTVAFLDVKSTNLLDNPSVQSLVAVLRDVTNIKQAEEGLRKSEERFRRLIQNSTDIILAMDAKAELTFVTPSIERILDYSEEEVMAQGFKQLIHPDDLLKVTTLYKTATAHAGPTYSYIARFRKKFGGYAYLDAKVVNLVQDTSVGMVVTTLHDITVLKEAEQNMLGSLEEKEVLLKEIFHRVKNNLLLVSSLLDFQSDQTDDEHVKAIFQDSQRRIYSIALVHEQLYQSRDLSRIGMDDYFKGLVTYIQQMYDIEDRIVFEMDIQPLVIDIDLAMRCGLVLNEILSNAMKYAFPGGRKGKVRIHTEVKDGQLVRLLVGDDGIGLPPDFKVKDTSSLGLRLVNMISMQLKTQLAISNNPGATFDFVFKQPA
jgi:PAS domain S-box-containing protein